MKKIYRIGVEATLEVIGGKWKPMILCYLGNGPIRTGELKRNLPNITSKMLTQQLRELEADKIISRKVYSQVPPKVEYALTDEGRTLRQLLVDMAEWGEHRVHERQAAGEDVALLHEDHGGYLNFEPVTTEA